MRWFRWTVAISDLSQDLRQVLSAIPGVTIGAEAITFPGDLAEVIGYFLQGHVTAAAWRGKGTPGNVIAPDDIPLYKGGLGLYAHQEEGLTFFQRMKGGIGRWPCGTGKTTAGVLWVLSEPPLEARRVLIVTQGSVTGQWLNRFDQITTVPPEMLHVVEGFSSWRVGPVQLQGELRAYAIGEPETKLPAGQMKMLQHIMEQPGRSVRTLLADPELPKVRMKGLQTLAEAGLLYLAPPPPAERARYVVEHTSTNARFYTMGNDTELLTATMEDIAAWKEIVANPGSYDALIRSTCWAYLQRLQMVPVAQIIREVEGALPNAEEAIRDALAYRVALAFKETKEHTLESAPKAGILIVGWPVLASRLRSLMHWRPTDIVFDEAQNASDGHHWRPIGMTADGKPERYERKATMAASAAALAELPTVQRVLCLTATPIQDRPRGLWSQLKLLDPKGWGKFRTFQERYCDGQPGEYGYNDEGVSNEAELSSRLSKLMHTVDEAVAFKDVPPATISVTKLRPEDQDVLGLDPAQEKRLRAGGPMAIMQHRIERAASGKTSYLVQRAVDCLDRGYGQVMILTGLTDHAREIAARLKALNVQVLLGTGDETTATDRQAMVTEFRAGERIVLVGTIYAWMVAIDGLQGTPKVLIGQFPWNINATQLLGRFRRYGATRSSDIEIVQSRETIEDQVYETVIRKLRAASCLLSDVDLGSLAGTLEGDVAAQDEEEILSLVSALLKNEVDE